MFTGIDVAALEVPGAWEMKEELQEIFDAYSIVDWKGTEGMNRKEALKNEILHIVAYNGELDHIRTLLENGADIDAIEDLGFTPLYSAALGGQAGSVKLLLSLGADTTIRNEFGQTALDVALVGKAVDACEALEEWEAQKHNLRYKPRSARVKAAMRRERYEEQLRTKIFTSVRFELGDRVKQNMRYVLASWNKTDVRVRILFEGMLARSEFRAAKRVEAAIRENLNRAQKSRNVKCVAESCAPGESITPAAHEVFVFRLGEWI
jgi:hypothetical protein